MVAIVSMLLLSTLNLAFGQAFQTGMKIAVTKNGLDYANQVGRTVLRNKLQTIPIPDQSGSEGSKTWRLWNIRVKSISGPDTLLSFNPSANGVTLAIFNFGITLDAAWNLNYRIIFHFSAYGTVDLSLSRASVTVVAGLGETGGRPSITVQSCSCRIDDIETHFHGGVTAFFLNIFKGTVRNKIRNALQDKVCDIVNTQINTRANEKLGEMKVSVEIARRFILDYSMTRAPTVRYNYIELANKGEVYWKGNRQESPFTAAALPAFNIFNKMMYIYITEYSVNTFLYAAHVNGYLKYNITVDELPADGLDLLNSTGQLTAQYTESAVELRISSWSTPSVKFNNQTITITGLVNARVVVNTQSGDVCPLELRFSVSVNIQPAIVNGKLTASIANYTLNTSVIRSDIGDINEQEFNAIIRQGVDAIVIPKLNEIGKQGVDLPVTGMLRLYNTQLTSQTGFLQVATDVYYQT